MPSFRPSRARLRARARALAFVAAGAALSASGCARPPAPIAPSPTSALATRGGASERYADPASWLCLPGRDDACARSVDATEIRPDLTRVVVRDTRAPGADQVDCFYV